MNFHQIMSLVDFVDNELSAEYDQFEMDKLIQGLDKNPGKINAFNCSFIAGVYSKLSVTVNGVEYGVFGMRF